MKNERTQESSRKTRLWATLLVSWSTFLALLLLVTLRTAFVTDYLYTRMVKDPPRTPPVGDNIVAPADGRILYVKEVKNGQVPIVIKNRTPIPLIEFFHTSEVKNQGGLLIGIFMGGHSVHLGRVPLSGTITQRTWVNGPHFSMGTFERQHILSALLPGKVFFERWLGIENEELINEADFILRSAREVLVLDGDFRCYITRIADYDVGKILTWVQPGQKVTKGEKFGIITYGSQTDIFIETQELEKLKINVETGQYVYGGETILASYKK